MCGPVAQLLGYHNGYNQQETPMGNGQSLQKTER